MARVIFPCYGGAQGLHPAQQRWDSDAAVGPLADPCARAETARRRVLALAAARGDFPRGVEATAGGGDSTGGSQVGKPPHFFSLLVI